MEIISKDEIRSMLAQYIQDVNTLESSVDYCAQDLIERFAPIQKAAARFEWLVANNAYIIECTTERYAFRSTAPNAVRELWNEHDGWTVSTLSIHVDPFPTMAEAVDYAMKVHNASNVV